MPHLLPLQEYVRACILDLIRKVKSSHSFFEGCDDSSSLCICQITYYEIMIGELELECLSGMFIWNVYPEYLSGMFIWNVVLLYYDVIRE